MRGVICVVARRRRWTLGQKPTLVEEVARPGASVAAVADRHGMSRSLLIEWRCHVRKGRCRAWCVQRRLGLVTIVAPLAVRCTSTLRRSRRSIVRIANSSSSS
jgi:hypothetical protein